jgi:DNA mismatch repair ATPase MutS
MAPSAALYGNGRAARCAALAALLRVIAAVGEVDAAVSVASYRTGASGWTRPVFRNQAPLSLTNIRHPLRASPVPNSIALGPPHGTLVTGSNMPGKSTFLRTVGVATVMAQRSIRVWQMPTRAPC